MCSAPGKVLGSLGAMVSVSVDAVGLDQVGQAQPRAPSRGMGVGSGHQQGA